MMMHNRGSLGDLLLRKRGLKKTEVWNDFIFRENAWNDDWIRCSSSIVM